MTTVFQLAGIAIDREHRTCSAHTGYITGQNILPDGGGYPGPV